MYNGCAQTATTTSHAASAPASQRHRTPQPTANSAYTGNKCRMPRLAWLNIAIAKYTAAPTRAVFRRRNANSPNNATGVFRRNATGK